MMADRVVQHATTQNRTSVDVRPAAQRAARLDKLQATFADPARRVSFVERAAMLDAVDAGPAKLAADSKGTSR
jgi:hypothetical protein